MQKILFLLLTLLPAIFLKAQDVEQMRIRTDSLEIAGELWKPVKFSKKRTPVFVLAAGSGPTDRFSNQPGMETNSFKYLADSLAQHGIATFLYDKRGVGKSGAGKFKENGMLFSHFVEDYKNILLYLRKNGYKKIFAGGHSEGSLIAGAAAAKMKVRSVISLAGAGYQIDQIIVKQLNEQSPILGHVGDSLFNILRTQGKVEKVPLLLGSIFRPSIQPYILNWMQYDPCAIYGSLKVPVLLINGTTDLQVSPDNAETLKKCNPKAELVIIEGMNHVLKDAPADRFENMKVYNQPLISVNEQLIQEIVRFIKKK